MSEKTPQPENDIKAVREALFATLRGLSDKTAPMDIERAKAVNEVAQTIINSAKVEIDALRVLGGKGSGFIPVEGLPAPKVDALPAPRPASNITHPKPGTLVHHCK
ncbi:MAG: hypothetical protein WC710_14700 [Gallionella sp.]|jgi:hypothetical protein